MMRTKGPISLQGIIAVAALALAGAGVSARAQSAGSYQLPPSPTPSASAQGPVVTDAPPPRVGATQAPEPAPSTSAPPPVTVPSPRPSPDATVSSARQRAVPTPSAPAPPITEPSPVAEPTPAPAAAPDQQQATAPAASSSLAAGDVSAPALPVAEPESQSLPPLVWAALALVLLTALVATIAVYRRKLEPREPEFEPPVVRKASSPAAAAPVPKPAPAALQPAHAAVLAVDLDAARMSASLVNATLAYRITLVAEADIEEVVVRGDMASAHASRSSEEQFGVEEAPILHRLARMEAGVKTELKGEIRLPLAAITPIRHGSAAMFVPLVRIEAAGMTGDGPVRVRSAFVIGLDEQGAARLQPFRLDQGPRVYQQVGQRTLAVPAFG